MIFYFSCTGNTRWAAEQLADATNDRMTSIFDCMDKPFTLHLRDGERIGFCVPVHGWNVQPLIRRFIRGLKIEMPPAADGSTAERMLHRVYTYFLLTCGDNCGEYAGQLEGMLKDKGLEVNTCCSVIMPESYVNLPFMDVDPALREAEKKLQAHSTVKRFAEIIVDRRSVRLHIERGAMPRFYSRVLGKVFYSTLVTDKRFHISEDKCTGCGLCVKHCPVGNMDMKETGGGSGKRTPEWLHTGRCLTCMACYHHCPKHAIDFWCFTKKKGQYYFDHNKKAK